MYQMYRQRLNANSLFKKRTALLNYSHTHLSIMTITILVPPTSMEKIKSHSLNSPAPTAVIGINQVLNKHLLNEKTH